MILTKAELIASLQNEVRILLHLSSKVEPGMLDYRPTSGQRSTIELLRYLSYMGPNLVRATLGGFDRAAWTVMQEAANARDLNQIIAAIGTQSEEYAALLADLTDADFRAEIEMFGRRSTRGAYLVNNVLCACAAYRTQLFLYLKICGRTELNTANLWAGVDPAPVPA